MSKTNWAGFSRLSTLLHALKGTTFSRLLLNFMMARHPKVTAARHPRMVSSAGFCRDKAAQGWCPRASLSIHCPWENEEALSFGHRSKMQLVLLRRDCIWAVTPFRGVPVHTQDKPHFPKS